MQIHLKHDLGEFKSLKFSDYKVNITVSGNYAYAAESCNYLIIRKDSTEVSGNNINTFVLKKQRQMEDNGIPQLIKAIVFKKMYGRR